GFARQEDLADLADEIEELRKKGDVNGFAATISADGIAREFIINHELDSLAVSVSVISLMANALVFVLWKIIDSNNIKIIFDQAPINENFRIIING
ncbi:MAG: hypothetical protein FWD01_04050, partial [Defluviitaleaceae bacterium]|nr:hypothetical protein [Defluviitaleaceae bacterium]